MSFDSKYQLVRSPIAIQETYGEIDPRSILEVSDSSTVETFTDVFQKITTTNVSKAK